MRNGVAIKTSNYDRDNVQNRTSNKDANRNERRNNIHNKATIRKRRITKLFVPLFLCWALLPPICFLVSFALVIYIGRLYVPEYNSDEDLFITIPLFLFFFIITTLPAGFLTTAIYSRLFIKKKGKAKAMKYLCELKKPPGILKIVWLRACGINQKDIQEYLRDYVN